MSVPVCCRLIGYLRVSTAKQGASGLGLEAQEAAIASYVASSGCRLIATYTEVESGRKSDRTELGKAIAHAKRLKATLVIAKMDRLSRNLHFITGLQESQVPFIACDNPHANTLTVHVLAAVAQDEARAISQRTKEALAAAKARGVTKTGKPWTEAKVSRNLTRDGSLRGSVAGVAAIRKAKAEAYSYIAPVIAEMRAQGLSLRAIATRLDQLGETTRSGKAWNAAQIARVLRYSEATR